MNELCDNTDASKRNTDWDESLFFSRADVGGLSLHPFVFTTESLLFFLYCSPGQELYWLFSSVRALKSRTLQWCFYFGAILPNTNCLLFSNWGFQHFWIKRGLISKYHNLPQNAPNVFFFLFSVLAPMTKVSCFLIWCKTCISQRKVRLAFVIVSSGLWLIDNAVVSLSV